MLIILITNLIYIPLGMALHVSQPYRVEGKGEQVPLNCFFSSQLRAEEMQVTLYKGLRGHEKICSAFVNLSEPFFTTNGTVHCRGNISSEGVDMNIFGLRGEDTDVYRCEVEILYPPPYLRRVGNGTIVYIQETQNCPKALIQSQSRISERSSVSHDPEELGPLPLLYAILSITCCVFILQIMKITWKWRDTVSPPMISQKDSYSKF